ncbi:MAG: hypothetical protein ABIA02_00110 [Candidatus Falkowbacteria bacterium]
MQNQLQKVIDLVKKTGDRIIVFDSANADNVYAIMSIKDYENLVLGRSEVRGLTEDELLDKINRDIAIWKSEQDLNNELTEKRQILADNFDYSKEKECSCDFNDYCDCEDEEFEDEIFDDELEDFKEENKRKAWSIPSNIKESAEEIIEEDRQYLENVPF